MEVPDSGVSVRTFSEEFTGCEVNFQVLKLKESFLVWIGSDRSFKNLAVAMKTRFDSLPMGTKLLGDVSDTSSISLAQRLSAKCGCQCFVSLNVQDTSLHPLIEEYLSKAIANEPHKFYF